MKIIETIALISINETLVVQLLSFLIFAYILHHIMVRPLTRVMEERTYFLERLEDDIDAAEETYEDLRHRIHSEEVAAREAAYKIRDDIEAAGEASAYKVIEDAKAQIRQMQHQARQEAEAQLAAARERIEAEAVDIAERMMAALFTDNSGK